MIVSLSYCLFDVIRLTTLLVWGILLSEVFYVY
jgi:hypothetical protein